MQQPIFSGTLTNLDTAGTAKYAALIQPEDGYDADEKFFRFIAPFDFTVSNLRWLVSALYLLLHRLLQIYAVLINKLR